MFNKSKMRLASPLYVETNSAKMKWVGQINKNYKDRLNELDLNLDLRVLVGENIPWYAAILGGLPAIAGSAVINEIFESALGKTVAYEFGNGDRYWAQSSNEIIPSAEELGETVSRYEEYYNNLLNQQLNGFLDHTMKQNQKVRLQNLTAAN